MNNEQEQCLVLRDNAKKQLEEIKSVETGINYLNKVKTLETWVKAEKKDAELQNMVAEQKIRTQRTIGQLIKLGQEKGEIVGKHEGINQYNKEVTNKSLATKKLSDIGLTHNESSTFQKIASIPDDTFEKTIAEKKEIINKAVSELTTTGMLKVAKELKRQEEKEKYQEKISKEVITNKFIDIFNTDKKFRIVYADPCWSYNDKQDISNLGGAEKHYETMSIKQLCELPINSISDNNAVLFLWVTSPILEECFEVIKAWGFKYKASFVWDKIKHNMGHYNSVRHEFLLICIKGSCSIDNKKLYDSVQQIEKTKEHSEKPIEFMNIIDDLYTFGNKIELFARDTKKENWLYWGNEI